MELLKKNIKNYQEHFEKLEQKLSKARLVPNWRKTQRKTAETIRTVSDPNFFLVWVWNLEIHDPQNHRVTTFVITFSKTHCTTPLLQFLRCDFAGSIFLSRMNCRDWYSKDLRRGSNLAANSWNEVSVHSFFVQGTKIYHSGASEKLWRHRKFLIHYKVAVNMIQELPPIYLPFSNLSCDFQRFTPCTSDMEPICESSCHATGLFALNRAIKVLKGSVCGSNRNFNNSYG
jgi:hypothetical protein